jgi:uncharacterized membrane protein YccC
VLPTVFALGLTVIDNPTLAIFAGFGSFAQLLLVDFGGPIRDRLQAQAALAAVGAVFIAAGTLASSAAGVAAAAMAVVAFVVIFSGVVSSVLAGATSSLLLAFILPVALPGPVSSIPDRLAGWGIASGAALLAIALLWPAPARDPLRDTAIAACRALAARLRADDEAAAARATSAVEALHTRFFASPYRPTGLSTSARTLVRLVDELRSLNEIVVDPVPHESAVDVLARDVNSKSAAVLEASADLLDKPDRSPDALRAAQAALGQAVGQLEHAITIGLPTVGSHREDQMRAAISSLDPCFRAQAASYVAAQIGRNVDLAAAAERRGWVDRVLGRQPAGLAGRVSAAQERAGAHVERSSVWLHNSVRGAAGLALAVLVAELSGVQHAFWVVLGTLSVLRSNALNTGQSVVRGLAGTAVGVIVGAGLVLLIGTDRSVLWVLLPVAVLLAGLAPAVSFAAGQAAFTLTLVILFNLLQPTGWQVGLVRIEDVAIGCAVSLAVGLLFWPRGATTALRKALAEAYVDSAHYLARAVEFGVARADAAVSRIPAPTRAAVDAAAASRRVDDAFRAYLAERGAKPFTMGEVTSLVTGVAALRLAGDAVLDLWQSNEPARGDRRVERREVLASARLMTRWYDDFAAGLTGRAAVPDPLEPDPAADGRLVDAVAHDLDSSEGQASATAVRMLWTEDHLDAARRLQGSLVGPARAT